MKSRKRASSGLYSAVHRAERVVALHRRLHDDAEAEHVHHLVEAFVLGCASSCRCSTAT